MEQDIRTKLDLSIDENNLLHEWKNQATLMFDYNVQLADAMQEEAEAKAALAVTAAELDRAIRAAPEDYEITKVTETTIFNAIMEQQEHIDATAAHLEARHSTHILQAAVNAIEHRKSSLKGMTDLFLRQWYADPKSNEQPAELREAAAGPPTKMIPGSKRRQTPRD